MMTTMSVERAEMERLAHLQHEFRFLEVLPDDTAAYVTMKRADVPDVVARPARRVFGTATGAPLPRDLRLIDPEFTGLWSEPCIVVRMLAVLVSLGPIRAVLLPDRVLLLSIGEKEKDGDELVERLRCAMRLPSISVLDVSAPAPATETSSSSASAFEEPLELRALNAIFAEVARRVQIEASVASERASTIMRSVLAEASSVGLDHLSLARSHVNAVAGKATQLRRAMLAFLDDDSDMAHALFHNVIANKERFAPQGERDPSFTEGHEQVETTLESYVLDVGSALGQLDLISNEMESTETYVRLRLDTARNQLLWVTIVLQAGMAIAVTGSLIKDVFAMNLYSGLQGVQGLFWALTGIVILGYPITLFAVVWWMKRSGYRPG